MAVLSTRALVLRSFPYGETSLVLRFYTEKLGVLGIMARGVRKAGSKGAGLPETFTRGVLTAYVKEGRGLQTMKDFAVERPRRALGRDPVRLAGASVLGEILLRHAEGEGSPALFRRIDEGLDRVSDAPVEERVAEILAQGWALVSDLGYRPELERCVACGRAFGDEDMTRLDFAAGGLRCPSCSEASRGPRIGPGARQDLGALVRGLAPAGLRRPRAHLGVLDDFVTFHLSGGRPLSSLPVLLDLLAVTRGGRRADNSS